MKKTFLLQKDNSKAYCKKTQGITLIALVVTIVVLLILASVTISTIFSNNGIIKKAQEAANKTKEAVEQEQAELKCTPNVRQKSLIIWVHFFVEKGQTKYVEK